MPAQRPPYRTLDDYRRRYGQYKADPALRAEFEAKLRDDAAFAASADARLDFFYRRHSAWDARYNLYPVLRADTVPTGDAAP